jgi:pyruvate/2-oxoglutarate dehydrogenase complex dihydrolipoamide acyltransferase (E2) component
MPTEVLVPKLGMTMTEGTVAEWCVPDGGEVEAGEIVYRLETEKINFEVEAESGGIVRHLVPEGTRLPPGTVVAFILAPGEALPEGAVAAAAAAALPPAEFAASASPGAARTSEGRHVASPIARRLARENGIALESLAGSGPGGRIVEADVLAARARPPARLRARPPGTPEAPAPAGAAAVAASPLARRLAEQFGLDLAGVRGTGPAGRITREDVEDASRLPRPTTAPARPATAAGPAAGTTIPWRGIRKVIAERMHASLQQMAQLTLGMDVTMDEAVKLRTQLVADWEPDGVRPSYTDLVVKAVAKALARHPLLNAVAGDQGIELLSAVHCGMAVALDDGLVVPVIRDAHIHSLKEIAAESSRLSDAAHAGALGLDEMAGSSFTVTPLGMYGVDFFTPIINPPNVAILGIGRIHDATAWEEERPVRRQQMTLSLTIDHRAVDGAPAARFLAAVKELLEAPYRLLV